MILLHGNRLKIVFFLVILFQSSDSARAIPTEKGGNVTKSKHMSMDQHAAHRAMMQSKAITVTQEKYHIPEILFINSEGNKVDLRKILNTDKPLALNFIFTTCTTICPVMTATFAQLRRKLKKQGIKLSFISITIDPDYDRPEVLKKYAANFNPGSDWIFLTGSGANISKIIKLFNANDGTKMNHRPLTLLKSPSGQEWIRVDGLAKSKDLIKIVTERLVN